MKILRLSTITKNERLRIMKRSAATYEDILPKVATVMNSVRSQGDQAILDDFQKRFGGTPTARDLCVSKKEIAEAYTQTNTQTIAALKQMIRNITAVQKVQLKKRTEPNAIPVPGIKVTRVFRPIETVGIYAPGGKAIYPSSVLMGAIPAKLAGCRDIILCSPARGGTMPAVTVVAANLVGITKIYKIGGPLAIAAMTYGTQTIPSVSKIVGAGNSTVTAAKMIAQQTVAIDMPAGPSEVMILADDMANSDFIAADLLADGEHAQDSACVLVTTSTRVADATARAIQRQLPALLTRARLAEALSRYGYIVVADSLREAIDFVNEYAPEHLEIMTRNPTRIVSRINNAGSVFVGPWTSKSSGDYATGANHILPTGGTAKMYPPLGVDSFGKWMQVQTCTKKGLKAIRDTIEVMADIEELPAHKMSTRIRFEKTI